MKRKTKIKRTEPLYDDLGRYLPYCDFSWHRGVPRAPEICVERGCKHYHKLRIEHNLELGFDARAKLEEGVKWYDIDFGKL